MLVARYTRWDGTQRPRLDGQRLFEKFADVLAHTSDVGQALDWIKRKGLEIDNRQVPGVDQLLERLRDEMRRRYRECNLREALSDIERMLADLLARERRRLESATRSEAGAFERSRRELERLPGKLSEALRRLEPYEFADAAARQSCEALRAEHENIRDLESFRQRYSDFFRGPRSLNYREAIRLMREMERMRALEHALASGDLERVSRQELGQLAGADVEAGLGEIEEAMTLLAQSGYLVERDRRVELTPRGIRRIGQLALRDILSGLARDRLGAHESAERGIGEPRLEASRPFVYGDAFNLDLIGTLKHALMRGGRTPLELRPGDFEVYESDQTSRAATVLCLDMSWSMSWEGRFAAAKRVAMAMEALMRAKYPRDFFSIVGFFTHAVELKSKELPEVSWNVGDPFTNLQGGLRLACDLLAGRRCRNRHIIVITDGQPTAYSANGRIHCEWPLSFGGLSMRAADAALREVARATDMGITINTFMLEDSPSLRAFVDKMTRINHGRALYTRPDRLGQYLLVDYVAKRRKVI